MLSASGEEVFLKAPIPNQHNNNIMICSLHEIWCSGGKTFLKHTYPLLDLLQISNASHSQGVDSIATSRAGSREKKKHKVINDNITTYWFVLTWRRSVVWILEGRGFSPCHLPPSTHSHSAPQRSGEYQPQGERGGDQLLQSLNHHIIKLSQDKD